METTEPVDLPRGFSSRFGRVAFAYTQAVHEVQCQGRRSERSAWDAGHQAGALRAFRQAEDRLAEMLRGLTAGRPAEYVGGMPHGRRRCIAWAEAHWGGSVFSLSEDGRTVVVRPSSLTIHLD